MLNKHTLKKFPWVSDFEYHSCCASACACRRRRNNSLEFTALREPSKSLIIRQGLLVPRSYAHNDFIYDFLHSHSTLYISMERKFRGIVRQTLRVHGSLGVSDSAISRTFNFREWANLLWIINILVHKLYQTWQVKDGRHHSDTLAISPKAYSCTLNLPSQSKEQH